MLNSNAHDKPIPASESATFKFKTYLCIPNSIFCCTN